MSDQNDETQNYALLALAGVLTLVIAGVLTLAIGTSRAGRTTPPAALAVGAAPVAGAGAVVAPTGRIYFELGSDAIPAESAAVIATVADTAKAKPGAKVLISGFHDASGDAAVNAELAKNRALVVRDALAAAGLPADSLLMAKPALTTGGADPKEARRVDLLVK